MKRRELMGNSDNVTENHGVGGSLPPLGTMTSMTYTDPYLVLDTFLGRVRRDGAGLHWSETKGTVWFDGPAAAKAILPAKVGAVLASDGPSDDVTIFVVHGCDERARKQLELRFGQLGLIPAVFSVPRAKKKPLAEFNRLALVAAPLDRGGKRLCGGLRNHEI